MAIRYWHWLLYQKKHEPQPQPDYYVISGTGEINEETVFDESDYDEYEYDGIIINTEQNENA